MNRKIVLLSKQSVLYSWTRYLLASIGIIIAIIAQIVASSMCQSYRIHSQDELIQSGAAIISVKVLTGDGSEAIDSLLGNIDMLSRAIPYCEEEGMIWTTIEKQKVFYAFTNDYYFEMGTSSLLEGEAKLSDKQSLENTAVVNDVFAHSTTPWLTVGSKLYINKIPFYIVGVVEDGRVDNKKMCYVHDCYLPDIVTEVQVGSNWLFPIKAKDLEYVSQLNNQIEEFLSNRYFDRIDYLSDQNSSNLNQIIKDYIYSVDYSESQYKQIVEKTNIIETMSLVFYILLLTVGVLSIFNVFHMLFLDRINEFGVSKSFGATTSDLMLQLMMETAFVGLCSVFFGVVIGVGLSYLAGLILNLKVIVVWKWVIISSIVVLVSTIVAGIIPSIRAASIDPSISINQ